jgi:hypothetical protein
MKLRIEIIEEQWVELNIPDLDNATLKMNLTTLELNG